MERYEVDRSITRAGAKKGCKLVKIKTFFVLLFVGVISAFNKDAMLFFAFPLLLPVAMILIFARAVWGGLGILSKKILGHD